MKIKTLKQLIAVLELLRRSQKEAARFPSKGRLAAARHWEGIVDGFLGEAAKP